MIGSWYVTAGSRRRALFPPEVVEQAPAEARDLTLPGVLHWVEDPTTSDGFFQGAYWAIGYAYSRFFGDVLAGPLLEQGSGVEVYQGGQWVPLD